MKVFEELGHVIESRWKDKNYNQEVFADISALALAEARINERVTAWEAIRWVQSTTQLPTQHDVGGRFGDPPITLYSGPRFYIDIYFWVDGTTAIHQHGFEGAFQVLLGSSIHSQYTFHLEHAINDRFLIGKVIFTDSELLKAGDIKKIFAGKKFIHSLFHLDRPSATITVRTFDAITTQPQYSYMKPHIAFDPFFQEVSITKKLQSVSLLLAVEHPDAEVMVGDLLACLDFQSTYSVLETLYFQSSNELDKALGRTEGKDRFNRLLGKARKKHGLLMDVIQPVLEEKERIRDLVKRRSFITSRDHRFFLALMLNVPNGAKVLELVRQFSPSKDPVETVMDWVTELSAVRVWGSSERNVLGIKNFNDAYLPVLQRLLQVFSLEQIKDASRKSSRKQRRQPGGQTGEIIQQLRTSAVFKAILADVGKM